MKFAMIASLFVAAFLLGGCACEHPTSFWWDTRLVPTSPSDRTVSGTGLTDYTPTAAVMPAPEVH